MKTCIIPQRARPTEGVWLVVALIGALVAAAPWHVDARGLQDAKGKPKLSVTINPPLGFANARLVATAVLAGGANDYEEFYCAKVEWDWGDGTVAESGDDCDPYQAGKSEIRRRFSQEHKYQEPGDYKVQFRLKQAKKIVAYAETTARIQ